MTLLSVAALARWIRIGNIHLYDSWRGGETGSAAAALKAIFYGTCLGLLGLTGFECVPMSIELIRPGGYPAVLRNLHYAATVLNGPLMLLVFANLPLQTILSGSNVLSLLAQDVAGRWLRIVVVVDASIVLCGGVVTGLLSTVSLLERLAR